MLNHVAILIPPLPQLNVELVSWYITKTYVSVVHNIELGGEGETKFVLSMFNNFVILAGMVSRVLSKIVDPLMVLADTLSRATISSPKTDQITEK